MSTTRDSSLSPSATHQPRKVASDRAVESTSWTIAQAGMGNWSLRALLGGRIQARLTVSQPGDTLEREADLMASSVVSGGEPAVNLKPT